MMNTHEWSAKNSAATTLSILGLHWHQERSGGELDELGLMEPLHKKVTAKIQELQKEDDLQQRDYQRWLYGEWQDRSSLEKPGQTQSTEPSEARGSQQTAERQPL